MIKIIKILAIKLAKRYTTEQGLKKHIKGKKKKKRILSKKEKHKQWMINRFGKVRYYLHFWLGEWILWI